METEGEKEKQLVPLQKVIGTSRGTAGDRVRASYKELGYPVEMVFYKDDEYFLTSDGNHRTLTVMLLSAESIKANVSVQVCDYAKREKYSAEQEFYAEYDILDDCQIV